MFEGSPCMPLAFMLHQRKYQTLHEDFFRILCRRIPNLKKTKVPIVTDREKGIMNASKDVLPNAQLLLCWNHLKQDVRRWLRSHGANQQDQKVYMDDIDTLLNSDSAQMFDEHYDKLSSNWSQPFKLYVDEHLMKDITDHCGKWILTPIRLYSPHS